MKIINNVIVILAVSFGLYHLMVYQYDKGYYKRNYGNLSGGYTSLSQFEKDLECLTLNIYMEGGIESIEGKLAIGVVTVNRLNSRKYGDTLCRVVYAKNQFSWTMNTPQNTKNLKYINREQYKISHDVAKKIIIEKFTINNLRNSLHYHGDYIATPVWAKNKKVSAKIGRHIFYEN